MFITTLLVIVEEMSDPQRHLQGKFFSVGSFYI